VIAGALASEFAVDLVETKGPGHAAELAADAARSRVDVVVALGGDGTINEGGNGLAGTDVPLGVLPGGGANVFARSIGLPRDPGGGGGGLFGAPPGPAPPDPARAHRRPLVPLQLRRRHRRDGRPSGGDTAVRQTDDRGPVLHVERRPCPGGRIRPPEAPHDGV